MYVYKHTSLIGGYGYNKTSRSMTCKSITAKDLPFLSEQDTVFIDIVEGFLYSKTSCPEDLFYDIVSGVSDWGGVHLKRKMHNGRTNMRWRTKRGTRLKTIAKSLGTIAMKTGVLTRKEFAYVLHNFYGEKGHKPKKRVTVDFNEAVESARKKLSQKVEIAIRKLGEYEMEDEDPMVDLVMQKMCVEGINENDMKNNFFEILFPHICLSGSHYSIRSPGDNS